METQFVQTLEERDAVARAADEADRERGAWLESVEFYDSPLMSLMTASQIFAVFGARDVMRAARDRDRCEVSRAGGLALYALAAQAGLAPATGARCRVCDNPVRFYVLVIRGGLHRNEHSYCDACMSAVLEGEAG